MSLPYSTATAGENALAECSKILSSFGCENFGTMVDVGRGITIVQFKWHDRQVSIEASWKGYAAAWLKEHPYKNKWARGTRQEHEEKAITQARISVCSVLRDWIKGQTTAVECGMMSIEAAFLAHIMLPTGERVIQRIQKEKILQLLPAA